MIELEKPIETSPEKQIYFREIGGLFKTVSTAPTHKPKTFADQIVIYTSGATYRIYWYDNANNTWHYVVATA